MMSHTMIRDVVRIWRLILRVRQGRNGRTMSYCRARFSRQVQKEKEKERKFKESCVWQRSLFHHFPCDVTGHQGGGSQFDALVAALRS